jgi:hypothetical protein
MRAKVTCFNSGVTFSAAAAWYHLVPYDMGILVEHGMGILGDNFHHDENNFAMGQKPRAQPRTLRFTPKITGIYIIYGC